MGVEELFSSKAAQSGDEFSRYFEISRREFYDGELAVEGDDVFDIQMEKAQTTPVTIIHITSRARMSYRRNSGHIRRNKAGFRVIWIVRHGSVTIFRNHGSCEIGAGQAGIVDSDSPFKATHAPDGDHPYDAFQVVVPPDLFFRHLNEAERFLDPFHLDGAHGEIARTLLELIVRRGDQLNQGTANSLSLALLDSIADHLRACKFDMPQRRTITDQRMADIENFIAMHITDPDISYEQVAENCGISSRYLSYLLTANGTSFSDLLWKNRLPKARDWLVSDKTSHFSIHEIAHMSGFKSASHFSRKFKSEFGCSPREYRARHLGPSDSTGA
jgi:AraC-like DNA-binding protein